VLSRKIAFLLNSLNKCVFTKIAVCLVVTLCISLTALLVTCDSAENGNWSCQRYFPRHKSKSLWKHVGSRILLQVIDNPNDPLVAVVSIDLMWMVESGEVSDLS